MKSILIISYYWPPSGGPGSQRVVKFAKYLPDFRFRPVILTVRNGEFPYQDSSLMADISNDCSVYRSKSIEPFLFYKKLTRRKKEDIIPVGILTYKQSAKSEKFAQWFRKNMFVPDARIGWIPFAIRKGLKIIKEHNIQLILTSSPPHSIQLIGLFLSMQTGLPWIADLRDPWTNIRYYKTIERLTITKKIDQFFEKKVLQRADIVTTVSNALKKEFVQKLSQSNENKFIILPNGFDESDFNGSGFEKSEFLKISHTGNLLAHQNPVILWQSLKKLFNKNMNFKRKIRIRFIGRVHPNIMNSIHQYQLQDITEVQGFVPHQQAVKEMKDAGILFMVVPDTEDNEGIITSKIFEYIGSGRPILIIGPPHGDAGRIISKFPQSIICNYDDEQKCVDYLENMYKSWDDDEIVESPYHLRECYSRRIITRHLANMCTKLIRSKPK